MTGRRSHGRLSALNGVVHQGSLLLQFRCPKADCESWLYVTPRKTNLEILRCRCMRINLNLKLK